MHLAAHLGDTEIMYQLIRARAPVDGAEAVESGHAPAARRSADWGPLHLLLARGDDAAVKQLLVWQADACKRGGPDQMNPLMLAISIGHLSVASQLLALPNVAQCVDDRDLRGRAALHFATMTPAADVTIVGMLLEAHATPGPKNEGGLTPIEVARNVGIPEQSQVIKRLQVEEAVRLVMQRSKCRALNKYEEAEMIRNELRLRGVTLDIQNERWTLADGTWGYLAAERSRAQAQGGPGSAFA